ncbi:hypothetical protein Aperf_G00000007666 [Anoplocephala perfoliata]
MEMTTQEALDVVYKDIAGLNVIQVADADRLGRKVVVFSACRLPDFDKDVYQRLYDYIRKTLEQYVANDYSLVYFHYGFTKEKRPPRRWMLQAYRDFDRNFKKNLKGLYVVHPTSHVHFIINFFRPFVSRKFGKKIHFINQLSELWVDMYLDQIPIPKRVKSHDIDLSQQRVSVEINDSHTKFKYPDAVQVSSLNDLQSPTKFHTNKYRVFGVSLDFIMRNNNNDPIPRLMYECVEYIRKYCLDVKGIFRECSSEDLVKFSQEMYDSGESVDFKDLGDPHLPAVLIKKFLRSLKEPLLTYELHDSIQSLHSEKEMKIIRKLVSVQLPKPNYTLLKYLMTLLTEVSAHSTQNQMTSADLAILFGPNLLWSRDANQISFTEVEHIISFTEVLISNFHDIFVR